MIYFQRHVDILLAEKDKQIELLVRQLQVANIALELERGRANEAVDQLLTRSGSSGILPPPPKMPEDIKKKFNEYMKSTAGVGGF